MRSLRAPVAALVAACLLVGTSALAQSPAASAAETLFREGKALYATQRYDDAIEKFRASQDLEPSVGVLLSLGDAYRARGRVASAWSAYVSAKDLAKTKGDSRVTDAEVRAAAVRPRLPHLTIRLRSAGDVSVQDNGLTLPPASFGSSLPVDPGPHTIVATAKGHRPFRATADLSEGQSREIVVPALEVEPLAQQAEPADATRRTVVAGLLIGGGALTVVGLVFGGLAISKWSTVADKCPNRVCENDSDRSAVRGDAKTADGFAIASTVTVAVGVLAVAAGVVLRVTAPSSTVALGPRGITFP